MDYLKANDEIAVRNALISGLLNLRKQVPGQSSFLYTQIVREVALTLVEQPIINEAIAAWSQKQQGYKTLPSGQQDEHPDNRKLLAAIWGLVGQGVVFPRLKHVSRDGYPHVIDALVLTERGVRTLSGDDHVLRPGFVARFKTRALNVTDEVVARMEDAILCVESSLLRAAVVMVGLAAEETLRQTHGAMVHTNLITKAAGPMTTTRQLVSDIDAAVKSWSGTKEERHRLARAVSAVEEIRTERNSASHPGAVTYDAQSVEALLNSAGYALPIFWSALAG